MDRFVIDNYAPGNTIKVYLGNNKVFDYSCGYSDIDKKIEMSGDEYFYLYSCSKITTVTAALQLLEKGIILLNDPLYEYIPEFKNMYSTAQSGAELSGDIDLMEKITWIDYQDAAPGAKIERIKINSIDGDNATDTVKYKDYNIPEPHKLKLKRIGGVWLLDDFDTMRKTCQEIIYQTTA